MKNGTVSIPNVPPTRIMNAREVKTFRIECGVCEVQELIQTADCKINPFSARYTPPVTELPEGWRIWSAGSLTCPDCEIPKFQYVVYPEETTDE